MSPRLNIVADAHIWGVKSAFSSMSGYDVDLQVLENKDISRESLKDADILLTRSATKVNADLLMGTAVKFVATATIGDDHYDKKWLNQNNITWATAAGSSTGSVIEYMLAAFLALHERGLISIPDTKLGVIGVGRIGSALAKVCDSMGMKVLLNDPPRQREEGGKVFSSAHELLSQADVITLHTPLIGEGDDATFHLIGADFLNQYQGKGIINAARGACVDNDALVDWLDGDTSRWAVLDCWEHEPHVSERLLHHAQVVIATPHIAGHSLDGKAANTAYVYDALCQFLGCDKTWQHTDDLPDVDDVVDVTPTGEMWSDLHHITQVLYPIMADHETFVSGQAGDVLADRFVRLRRNYPVRRAWALQNVGVRQLEKTLRLMVCSMGIKVREV